MGAGPSTSRSEEINEEPKKQISRQITPKKQTNVSKQPSNNDQNEYIQSKEPHMHQSSEPKKQIPRQITPKKQTHDLKQPSNNDQNEYIQSKEPHMHQSSEPKKQIPRQITPKKQMHDLKQPSNNDQNEYIQSKEPHMHQPIKTIMLFARDLSITWSDDDRYWQWVSCKESSGEEIDLAKLLDVCWLEIHGRLETSELTPGVVYEVVFIVNMELGYGWAKPVTLRLKLPNGVVQQHEECLLELPKGNWVELKAGEFKADSKIVGEMEFSLYEYESGQWKRGLIVKGVLIRPKKH